MRYSSFPHLTSKIRNAWLSHVRGAHLILRSRNNEQPLKRFMTTQQPKRNWRDYWINSGSLEVIIGSMLALQLGYTYYTQRQQEGIRQERQEMMLEFESAIRRDEEKQSKIEEDGAHVNKAKLYNSIVRRVPKNFDGSKSLMGVHVGDRVAVLEEYVGPDENYHLCKLEKEHRGKDDAVASIGWFPINCLEKC